MGRYEQEAMKEGWIKYQALRDASREVVKYHDGVANTPDSSRPPPLNLMAELKKALKEVDAWQDSLGD